MKRGIITMLICAVSFCAHPAQATLITIEIEGVVDDVYDYGHLEGKIKPGDIITGSYTYDTSTPDSNPVPQLGYYHHYVSPCGISLTVGGFEFKTDPASVNFLVEINDHPFGGYDIYSLISHHNLPLYNGTLSVDYIECSLRDPTGNALSSDALPTTAPVLDDWGDNRLVVHGPRDAAAYFWIEGHVTSAVPEPTAIVLFGLGMLLLRKRG